MGFLRTILAITVVFAHSPWHGGFVFVGGRNAVQLFYIISGFLISYVINTNATYRNPWKFYINRALRIYPIYYVVALISLLVVPLWNHKLIDIYRNIPATADVFLIFSNLFLFGQDWVMFSGIKNGHLVLTSDFLQSDFLLFKGLLVRQAWTLGVELTFYALAPFILRNNRIVILLIILSLSIRGFLFSIGLGMSDPWTYRFFPAELSFFLFGALANQYLLPMWKRFILSTGLEWIPRAGTYILICFCLFYFLIPAKEIFKAALLFSVFLTFLPLTFLYQNTSKSDKAIGELSYPIYIGHLFAITVVGKLIGHHILPTPFMVAMGNVFFAIIFAYYLNKYISRRVEYLRVKVKSL
jgi:peptidoglycan/LPS O-acetylase OafA/YrhL